MNANDIETITNEMREIRQQIEEKNLTMRHAKRPVLSSVAENEQLHLKALDRYLRKGDESELRALGFEEKALSKAVNSDGGFLIDPETSNQITASLGDHASLRHVANVVNVEAGSYDVLVDHGGFQSGWVGESDAREETDNADLARISIALHELSAMPKASQRLLDDAAFDIESWLGERIAQSFSHSESEAFILGDGVNKPKGILAHSTLEDAVWEWGNIGYVPTGVDGDFDGSKPADALIELIYALPAQYRKNASFVMNSQTAGAVRKMKDGDGRFLWNEGFDSEKMALLMGYPVLICEDMPNVAADSFGIAFGDFHAAYTIAERPDLRILRDPFSAKPHVLFYATKRVGGDVTDFAAIKLLKFAAS